MKDAYSPEEIKELLKENQELKSLNNVHTFAVSGLTKENEQLREMNETLRDRIKSELALNAELLEALKTAYELLNVGQPLGNDDLEKMALAIAKAEPK